MLRRLIRHAGFIIHDYFKLQRFQILETVINQRKYENIAEVGIAKCETTKYILKKCQSIKKYHGIDPYDEKNYDQTKQQLNNEYMQQCMEKALKITDKRFNFYRLNSTKASALFEDESLDLVFIDANHSYARVKEDIKAWLPKIRKGGILAGHDYDLAFMGCVSAVNEALGADNIQFMGGNGTWIYKKEV